VKTIGHFAAVEAGHHHVQQHNVGHETFGYMDGFHGIVHDLGRVTPGVVQIQFEQARKAWFIVHNQDAFF
jgi:hypothetical protein